MIELSKYFFKLGSTGFGGPIAMIGMMEQHFVRDVKSLTDDEFKRFVATAKLFPGPVASLVAIQIGVRLQGKKGGLVAGLLQILPAFFIILLLSHFMVGAKNNSNIIFSQVFTGLNFGGLALSLVAAIRFSKPLLSAQSLIYMLSTAILVYYYPREEIYFLVACGILQLIYHRFKNHLFEASSVILIPLFFESLKASLLTYGTGMAIVPVLKAVYIDQYHWVSQSDFLTALSFGQITPGPLIICNTYLGSQIAGIPGAILATLGIFIPTFIFGLWAIPTFGNRLLNTNTLKIFFQGMLPAVGGAIIGSVFRLCVFAVEQPAGTYSIHYILLLIVLSVAAFKSNLHPVLVIVLGAMLAIVDSYLF